MNTPTYNYVPDKWKHVAKEWVSWKGAIKRCCAKSNPSYKYCGAKGLQVCDRWRHSFANFLEDVGLAPSSKHTIDRKDNKKGYEPGNCRWATPREQQINTCKVKMLTVNGETLCLADWGRKTDKSANTITSRLKSGWTINDAVMLPAMQKYNHHKLKKLELA